jgi:ectoine hydroxylase-related dioxygenase (phytanoyl-CoA dioxygenase family)
MDPACLNYCLTEEERRTFEEKGFFIVEDVLPPPLVKDVEAVVDRIDAQHRAENNVGPHERVNLLDFIGKDEVFLDLLDWPKTFPKVWGILGWNIQLYHTHMAVTPPGPPGEAPSKKRLGWHQDSGRLNVELETAPRPRVSLKVAFFLTDTRELGRANFYVIPGSHLQNRVAYPEDGVSDPEGTTPVRAPAGSAVFFDRRIWHAASPNSSQVTRRVLFYGYSYRWLRPRDNMTVAHFMDRCDPIRRQLLGASTGGFGYTSPGDADVPLKGWIKEHLGEAAVAP